MIKHGVGSGAIVRILHWRRLLTHSITFLTIKGFFICIIPLSSIHPIQFILRRYIWRVICNVHYLVPTISKLMMGGRNSIRPWHFNYSVGLSLWCPTIKLNSSSSRIIISVRLKHLSNPSLPIASTTSIAGWWIHEITIYNISRTALFVLIIN